MSVIKLGEQRPKLERMARHWPRNIQEYWRQEEERHLGLPGKLLAETLRIDARSRSQHYAFAKRKSYQVPPNGMSH